MGTESIPARISRAELCRRVEAAGFDPTRLESMYVDRRGIRVTLYRVDERGRRYVGPDDVPAVETYNIGVA